MKIGYFGSGALGLSTLLATESSFVPAFIATDQNSLGVADYAVKKGIRLFKGNPRDARLADFLKNETFDLFLSVNYLFILENDIIKLAKHAINLHGSLLPKYRGRTPHIWAIINNENKTGITAHIIKDVCDAGDVVLQREVKIETNDTGADILKKFQIVYPEIIKEILNRAKAEKLFGISQNELLATYFGKRKPEDGLIDWNWQKERIRNWVRAQAAPYPGSFTYYDNDKLIIDELSWSDFGYNQNQPNGLILKVFPKVLVKTPNGVVQLESYRFDQTQLVEGKILKSCI